MAQYTKQQVREFERLAFSRPGLPTNEEQIEAFYLAWEDRIRTTIAGYVKQGDYISPEEVDDAFQTLMTVWLTEDWISKYNPDTGYAVSTFVYSFVKQRMLRIWDNLQKERRRNHIPTAAQAEAAATRGLAWIDELMPNTTVLDESFENALVDELQERVDKMPKSATRDMGRLLRAIRHQVETEGRINQSKLAAEFGVSNSTITNQMNLLRQNLINRNLVQVSPMSGNVSWSSALTGG